MGTPVVKHGREGGLNKMFCGEREEREREKDGRCCAIQEQDKEMMWVFSLPIQETIR